MVTFICFQSSIELQVEDYQDKLCQNDIFYYPAAPCNVLEKV